MKWIAIAARILLGGLYLMSSVMFFFKLVDMPLQQGHAGNFLSALAATNYLTVIKVIEVIGAILLLSGQFTRFATLWILPVTLNVFLFHVLMDPANAAVSVIMLVLNLFLVWFYKDDYKVLLKR
jgi:uncharacterized membrane protein YphA (DoxX/SURF4 family)